MKANKRKLNNEWQNPLATNLLQKYDYDLEFSDGAVRDSRRGEPMSIKAERSVRERLMRGESTSREAAEASGINFLDKQLPTAEVGDSVVWARIYFDSLLCILFCVCIFLCAFVNQ